MTAAPTPTSSSYQKGGTAAEQTAIKRGLASKALINSFYGSAPRFSYFTGCSAGGRQALKAAQMYPADFDGTQNAALLNFDDEDADDEECAVERGRHHGVEHRRARVPLRAEHL
mgnify:CR=1 FL=1